MEDILLDRSTHDIVVSDSGDITIANSVSQKIKIRLLWFLGEWKWNPDAGLPYFDELLKKAPNLMTFKTQIRNEIMNVTEVTKVDYVNIDINKQTRQATISFCAETDEETIREEVKIYG